MGDTLDHEYGSVTVYGLKPTNRTFPETYRVIDGDTIAVGPERWRLYGWDAPPIAGSRGSPCCAEAQRKGEAAKLYFEYLMRKAAGEGRLHITVRNLVDGYGRRLVDITSVVCASSSCCRG